MSRTKLDIYEESNESVAWTVTLATSEILG